MERHSSNPPLAPSLATPLRNTVILAKRRNFCNIESREVSDSPPFENARRTTYLQRKLEQDFWLNVMRCCSIETYNCSQVLDCWRKLGLLRPPRASKLLLFKRGVRSQERLIRFSPDFSFAYFRSPRSFFNKTYSFALTAHAQHSSPSWWSEIKICCSSPVQPETKRNKVILNGTIDHHTNFRDTFFAEKEEKDFKESRERDPEKILKGTFRLSW